MDLSIIKKLIKLVESSQINELEIREENLQIRINKGQAAFPVAAPKVIQPVKAQPATPVEVSMDVQEARVETTGSEEGNTVEICSPMVGTFYRAASPDAEPFVREGDVIAPGQILCIIEAMKLMNEIEAEISGKIVKVLVENTQPVEYDHPLFLVEKLSEIC